jgi:hypothetical protein
MYVRKTDIYAVSKYLSPTHTHTHTHIYTFTPTLGERTWSGSSKKDTHVKHTYICTHIHTHTSTSGEGVHEATYQHTVYTRAHILTIFFSYIFTIFFSYIFTIFFSYTFATLFFLHMHNIFRRGRAWSDSPTEDTHVTHTYICTHIHAHTSTSGEGAHGPTHDGSRKTRGGSAGPRAATARRAQEKVCICMLVHLRICTLIWVGGFGSTAI